MQSHRPLASIPGADEEWPSEYQFDAVPPAPVATHSGPLPAPLRVDEPALESDWTDDSQPDASRGQAADADAGSPSASPERAPFPKSAKPNHFPAFASRSSLFAASVGEGSVKGRIAAAKHYPSIECDGPRLSMRDKHVWEAAVEAGRAHGWLGEEFPLSLSSVVKRRGVSDTSGPALDAILDRLKRLAKVTVSFELENGAVGSGLMLLSVRQAATGEVFVALDPALIEPAFNMETLFPSRPKRRAALRTDAGEWLHDYLSINENHPDGFMLEELRTMSGFAPSAKRFSSALKEALATLADPAAMGAEDGACPVASFRFEKLGRGAATWKLRVERGAEKVTYVMAAPERAKRAAAKAHGAGTARSGHGG